LIRLAPGSRQHAVCTILDLISTGREWFFPVGLPVTVAGFIASALIALSGYCIITEIIFDL